MAQRRKRDGQVARHPSWFRRSHRVISWVSGAVCVAAFVSIFAYQFFGNEKPSDAHSHPPALHSGQVVVFKAGPIHYHVEFVVEPTGVVHLFPLDESATQPLPVDSQTLVFTVTSPSTGETLPVMLRPVLEKGAGVETTTQFIGRLPTRAVSGNLLVRFTEFKVRGERFRFEFDWVSPLGNEAFRSAFDDEQRRIFLSVGGKYLDSDIRVNGGCPADAGVASIAPSHDHTPTPGDRVCPVSGFKAEPTITWLIGGQKYWFCCLPCIDEFVLLAKEKPEKVKPVERYVR